MLIFDTPAHDSLLLIPIIVGIVVFVITRDLSNDIDVVGIIFCAAMISFLLTGFFLFFVRIPPTTYNYEKDCTVQLLDKTPILSLRDDSPSLSGSFILGTGGVQTIDSYNTYINTDKGLLLLKLSTHNTYLQEGYDEPMKLDYSFICPRSDFVKFFYPNIRDHERFSHHILQVPSNTVYKSFSVGK